MNNVERSVRSFLIKSWKEGTKINKLNALAASIVGTGSNFCFYFIFKLFNIPYENFWLSMSAAALCFPAFFIHKKKGLKLEIYWHFVIIFALPFLVTFHLLKTNFHEMWLWWEIFMVTVLIMYIPNWFMFLCDLLIGVSAAIVFYLATPETSVPFDPHFNAILYAIVLVFTSVTGLFFAWANFKGVIDQEKTELISLGTSIAHEMRNPLNSVINSFEALKLLLPPKNNKNDTANCLSKTDLLEAHSIIENSILTIQRGNKIIDSILANIKGGDIDKSDFQVTCASNSILEAINSFSYKNLNDKKLIIYDQKNNDEFDFFGDRDLFIYVIFNLIKNALYYKDTKKDFSITITSKKLSENANIIKVLDNGPGIPKNKLESIFQSFSTSNKKGGTGLGLPFCRRVINSFGGNIICNSQTGQWTEFTITLPPVNSEKSKAIREKILESKAKKNNATGKLNSLIDHNNGKKRRIKNIIFAEDDTTSSKLSQFILEKTGYNVLLAENGQEVIDLLKKNAVDLIFMDTEMPVLNGLETTKLIRKIKNYSNIIIIGTSGNSDQDSVNKAKEAGMDDFLGKPISKNDLIQMIYKWSKKVAR